MSRKDRKKNLPFIPLQPNDMDAAYAGKQYIINDAWSRDNERSRMYQVFRDTLYRLLFANFVWEGDITEQEAHALEQFLLMHGRVCAIKTEFSTDDLTPDGIFYGYFGSNNKVQPLYDFYGNPLSASCTGLNDREYYADSPEKFVLGFDTTAYNITGPYIVPPYTYMDTLALALDEAYQAWLVAVETHKQGIAFQVENKQTEENLKKMLSKMSDNNPYVILKGEMAENMQILYRTNGADAVEVYHQNFMNVWSLVLDFLGIENESEQKRERLVVEEAIRNGSLAKCIGADRLRARQSFAEQISDKFGINLQVKNYFTEMIRAETDNMEDNSNDQSDNNNDNRNSDSGNS